MHHSNLEEHVPELKGVKRNLRAACGLFLLLSLTIMWLNIWGRYVLPIELTGWLESYRFFYKDGVQKIREHGEDFAVAWVLSYQFGAGID